jgi:hypothetical protein
MKIISHIVGVGILSATLLAVGADTPPPGYVNFGKLAPGSTGAEFVEVNVGPNLISIAARLAEKGQPEVAQLLRKLQMVRVNVIGLTDENRDQVQDRIKSIRGDLDAQGWERIVLAQEKQQDVAVFLKTRGEEAVQGLVVIVCDGAKQAVLVNIVGDIRPEQVAELGEKLGIDPLKKVGKSMHGSHK